MCRSSVMIRWMSIFGSPNSCAINRTLTSVPIQNSLNRSHIVLSSWSWRTPCALFILKALPSVLEHLVPPEDLGWRQNNIPVSCPQQLQHFRTRFSEFRAEHDRVTLLQTAFSPVTRHENYTHFANVPTATKARTQLKKIKLYTWVPPPSASTTTFISWPFCAAQKKSFSLLLGLTSYIWQCLSHKWVSERTFGGNSTTVQGCIKVQASRAAVLVPTCKRR